MKALDYIESTTTGTGKARVETEFKVPEWASYITRFVAFVNQDMPTRGEYPVIAYEVWRDTDRLALFHSAAMHPPEMFVNFKDHDDMPQLAPIKNVYCNIPVTPGETLKLVRQNVNYYCCSPMAGLEIEYSNRPFGQNNT